MSRLTILLAVCLMWTGPTLAVAAPITEDVFEKEFLLYVTTPCMRALIDKAGLRDHITKDADVSGAEHTALMMYRFDDDQVTDFGHHISKRKIYLSNTVREKPLHIRKAWYGVTVELCKKKLPE